MTNPWTGWDPMARSLYRPTRTIKGKVDRQTDRQTDVSSLSQPISLCWSLVTAELKMIKMVATDNTTDHDPDSFFVCINQLSWLVQLEVYQSRLHIHRHATIQQLCVHNVHTYQQWTRDNCISWTVSSSCIFSILNKVKQMWICIAHYV